MVTIMAGKMAKAMSLLTLSVILIVGLAANGGTNTQNGAHKEGTGSTGASFSPSFNGMKYSSGTSSRIVDEYLAGQNQSATIKNIVTDTLHIDGPAGWTGQSFSTVVYNLFENGSFLRNSDFSSGTTSPQYWSDSATTTQLVPSYDTTNRWVYILAKTGGYNSGDNANWTQTIYVNRSSVQGAQIQFKIWKNGTNTNRLNATVSVNSKRIWTNTHDQLQPQASAQTISVNLNTGQLPSLPGNLVVTLELSNPNGNNIASNNKGVFFDDVYFYVKCKPYPESADLKIKLGAISYPMVGYGYGNGRASLSLSTSPPYDFKFTSNSTGISLKCNSTVNIHQISLSGSTEFTATKGSSILSYNVSKSAFFDSSTKTYTSTQYTQDVLNVSIPHDWNYTNLVLPDGTSGAGLVNKYDNNSFSWMIMVNVTAIGIFRPGAYIIEAVSNNYLGTISTYRSVGSTWVSGSTFTTNDKLRINATLWHSTPRGSAYVVFDNASDYSLYLNMSAYTSPPDSNGVMPFTFLWSQTNVTKSVLITLALWSNGSSYGVNWVIVRFDIDPPQLSIGLPSTGKYVDPSFGETYFGGAVKSVVLSLSANDREGNLDNVSLFIDGTNTATYYTSSFIFPWNISVYAFRQVNLTLLGWDQYGNKNRTETMVYIDNIAPSTPSLTYPNNGEEFNSTTLGLPLNWLASSDSGSGVKYYVLQLDTSPNFNSANFRNITWTATSYPIPNDEPLSNGTWYWHVRAVDNVGNVGGYSSVRSFQVIVKLAPPNEGLPLPLLIGLIGGIPALAILSSIIFLRRKKAQADTGQYNMKSLMAAYVFSSDGRAMFSHAFKETKVEPQLLSGFLTAISEMMKEVIGGDRRPLRTIERSDAKILIEFGTSLTGALVAKEASREYRRRLRAFIARFEDDYANKIPKWDGDQAIFQAAPEIIEEVFAPSANIATYPTIAGLEDLLVSEKLGGVAVSVSGKTGTSKTEFCLRYAASLLKRGKPVITVAASISPTETREQLKSNGVKLEKVEGQGILIIYDAYSGVAGIQSEEKYKFGSPGELNNINMTLSRNLGKLKNVTIFFDSLSTMIDYSDLELAVDFVRTVKAKLQQGGHTAFFIVDSNAHDENTLNYILHVMDGEIEAVAEAKKKGEIETLVSFKRLKGFKVKPGYHEFK